MLFNYDWYLWASSRKYSSSSRMHHLQEVFWSSPRIWGGKRDTLKYNARREIEFGPWKESLTSIRMHSEVRYCIQNFGNWHQHLVVQKTGGELKRIKNSEHRFLNVPAARIAFAAATLLELVATISRESPMLSTQLGLPPFRKSLQEI